MEIVKRIYDSLQGNLTEEARLSWVKDAFAPDSICEREYAAMRCAYKRLCERLGTDVDDEDEDLNALVDALESIQKELCRDMFLYGIKYAGMR